MPVGVMTLLLPRINWRRVRPGRSGGAMVWASGLVASSEKLRILMVIRMRTDFDGNQLFPGRIRTAPVPR